MKILVIEDDKALNNGIALTLGGYEIVQAFNLAQGKELFSSDIDLIILDINLPDGNGLDFCREIKKQSKVPLIFLTANDMEIDVVTGLESGADDYITKPFSLAILRARVSAVLRRREEDREEGTERNHRRQGTFQQGMFSFDFEQMKFLVDSQAAELSKTEQKLLRLLTQNAGQTLTRDFLLDSIWPDGTEYVDTNALSVTMNRLREKLPGIPVKTVYGIGYMWEKSS